MDLARRACVREVHLMMGKSQFKTVISGTNLGFMVKMGLVNHPIHRYLFQIRVWG
jgi:hypothetical protein